MNIFEKEVVKLINMDQFSEIFNDDVKRVIKSIRKYGFDIRVVGGAVRDFLLGKSPRDVDFATDADPAELILIFDLEGIQYDAKGIIHGTVKAVFGNEKVDVTSITYKLEVEDDKMKVVRSQGWEADARSRDLTINSLSLDMDGNIYDYVDGIDDIKAGVIRLNTSQRDKIVHDPNIIMRWFKALGYFPNPKWPTKDFQLIRDSLHLLERVKDDPKTGKTLGSIIGYDNSKSIVDLMCRLGADRYINITCD
jgi:tRNA nucleotidyltransferase (CCA-adding enzyme)